MLSKSSQPLIKLMAEIADRLRVLSHLLLPPTISHGLQQSDQSSRRSQYHSLLDSELDQRRVLFKRRTEERLAGQKQHNELRCAVELFPIALKSRSGVVVVKSPGASPVL